MSAVRTDAEIEAYRDGVKADLRKRFGQSLDRRLRFLFDKIKQFSGSAGTDWLSAPDKDGYMVGDNPEVLIPFLVCFGEDPAGRWTPIEPEEILRIARESLVHRPDLMNPFVNAYKGRFAN